MTAVKRSSALPAIPTIAEAALPGYDITDDEKRLLYRTMIKGKPTH